MNQQLVDCPRYGEFFRRVLDGRLVVDVEEGTVVGLKPFVGGNRRCYLFIRCRVDGGRVTIPVSRLVWILCHDSFMPDDGQIDHIDCVPDNNRISNLELVTPDENLRRRVDRISQEEVTELDEFLE